MLPLCFGCTTTYIHPSTVWAGLDTVPRKPTLSVPGIVKVVHLRGERLKCRSKVLAPVHNYENYDNFKLSQPNFPNFNFYTYIESLGLYAFKAIVKIK